MGKQTTTRTPAKAAKAPAKAAKTSTKAPAKNASTRDLAKAAAKAPARAPAKATASAKASAGGGGPVRMTPKCSIVVMNECFHNGNVEAWKRIVASYNSAYPDLKVFIYYDNERIMDINSLFKWGKVKHGNIIEFAVAGKDIKDVAKLKRYLEQGASPQFEAFLRGPVNTIMKLF